MNGNCVDYDFTKRPATPHAAPETLSPHVYCYVRALLLHDAHDV